MSVDWAFYAFMLHNAVKSDNSNKFSTKIQSYLCNYFRQMQKNAASPV